MIVTVIDDLDASSMLDVVDVSGVSISTMGGVLAVETVSATDSRIARVDELQFDLGEGPSWDAVDAGRPVLEPDVRRAPRRVWPVFSRALDAEPIGALFAFPMAVGPLRIGAIGLYDTAPRELSDEDVANVAGLAARAGMQVLRRALSYAGLDEDEVLPRHARRIIHQATGFVIAQAEVNAEEAEMLLRATAFAEGRPMRDVAEQIVSRQRRFTLEGTIIEDAR